MKSEKMRIGVSRCLLGENVRYDGGHKLDHYITDTLGRYFDFVGVCPEVEYGLPVPRESMHLTGEPGAPRLVTIRTGIDHTEGMKTWARRRVEDLEREELSGFIFKSRSPSSGMQGVPVYNPETKIGLRKGTGIFAAAFMERFPLIPVEDEGRLNDPLLKENFIERVFVYGRWQLFMRNDGSIRGLIDFHRDHKLLIMAHSPRHYAALGRLVANPNEDREGLLAGYLVLLLEGLKLPATARKNTNVLQHIMGYFKKQLTTDEKRELLEVIESYRQGLVPLVVPVTLLKHYVRKYDEKYLQQQHYLNPHPAELMLRNHV